jgi:hypothetical protein
VSGLIHPQHVHRATGDTDATARTFLGFKFSDCHDFYSLAAWKPSPADFFLEFQVMLLDDIFRGAQATPIYVLTIITQGYIKMHENPFAGPIDNRGSID